MDKVDLIQLSLFSTLILVAVAIFVEDEGSKLEIKEDEVAELKDQIFQLECQLGIDKISTISVSDMCWRVLVSDRPVCDGSGRHFNSLVGEHLWELEYFPTDENGNWFIPEFIPDA